MALQTAALAMQGPDLLPGTSMDAMLAQLERLQAMLKQMPFLEGHLPRRVDGGGANEWTIATVQSYCGSCHGSSGGSGSRQKGFNYRR
jgi:hypothetical protein